MLVTSKKKPETIDPGSTANLFVEFVEAIRADRAYRIPAEDCLYATEVVLKARDAADNKTMVVLAQPRTGHRITSTPAAHRALRRPS